MLNSSNRMKFAASICEILYHLRDQPLSPGLSLSSLSLLSPSLLPLLLPISLACWGGLLFPLWKWLLPPCLWLLLPFLWLLLHRLWLPLRRLRLPLPWLRLLQEERPGRILEHLLRQRALASHWKSCRFGSSIVCLPSPYAHQLGGCPWNLPSC